MFGIHITIGSFLSPMFFIISGVGAYFIFLAILEKTGRSNGQLATTSGILAAIGTFIYCYLTL